jgi:hypothetical protein
MLLNRAGIEPFDLALGCLRTPPSSQAWRTMPRVWPTASGARPSNVNVDCSSIREVRAAPLGGFAADPPTAPMASSDDQSGSNAQLVEAMASFGGGSGAADSLNTAPLGAETSQQTFLTTPHA